VRLRWCEEIHTAISSLSSPEILLLSAWVQSLEKEKPFSDWVNGLRCLNP
jgi:hypothetical protein